jgi:hypothetical protein
MSQRSGARRILPDRIYLAAAAFSRFRFWSGSAQRYSSMASRSLVSIAYLAPNSCIDVIGMVT